MHRNTAASRVTAAGPAAQLKREYAPPFARELESELTPDAIELGLGAALPAIVEIGEPSARDPKDPVPLSGWSAMLHAEG